MVAGPKNHGSLAASSVLESLLYRAPVAVHLRDLEGRLLYVNPRFAEQLDAPAEQLVGRTDLELFGEAVANRLRADDQRVLESGRALSCEERLPLPRGGQSFSALKIPILGDEGEPRGVLVISSERARDDTRQAVGEMERHLARSERMASLGLLAAGAAHEINNPLTYIISNLDFAIDQWGSPDAEDAEAVQSALREAQEGAERVREIVSDLKTFSRDSVDDELGEVDVERVLRSVTNMAHGEIRHRARLAWELERLPPAHATEARLSQIFLNLLINAAHAIEPNHVADNEIRIGGARLGEDEVCISISDTGHGIPAESLPRIFDPFFTTKPVDGGTGLGLAVCHNQVEALGGRMEVDSEVGKGSTFRVVLKVAQAIRAGRIPREAEARPGAAAILVVDDDVLAARGIARQLSRHRVTVVTRGTTALETLRNSDFDVVLCDVLMPDMTGIELHAQVVEFSPELGERFVFFSGGVFVPELAAALAWMPNPCLDKPLDIRKLDALIVEMRRSRVTVS